MPWVSNEPSTIGELRCLHANTTVAFLCYFELETGEMGNENCSEIQEVIDGYSEIFSKPRGLPPHRERDHYIHLESEARPVNVRPYRYL